MDKESQGIGLVRPGTSTGYSTMADDNEGGVGYKGKNRISNTTCCLLVCALVFFIATTIALAVALGVVSKQRGGGNTNDCLTLECADLLANVVTGLDQTADPCEDFYKFSCGNWIDNTKIPDTAAIYNTLSTLGASNKQKLQNALLQMESLQTIDALGKVQDLYQSCINTNLTNSLGLAPLRDLIRRTGGWSLVGIPNTTSWSFNGDQFFQEKLLGSPAFFTLGVIQDQAYTSKYTIIVVNSGLTVPDPSYYTDPLSLLNLKDFIVSKLQKVNDSVPMSTYEDAADSIVAVETTLAEFYEVIDSTDMEAYLKHYLSKRPLSYLSTLWSGYDWVNNTQALFSAAGLEGITGDESIALFSSSYFGNLTKILSAFSVDTLTNYAKWQVVHGALVYLDDKTVQSYHEFKRKSQPDFVIPQSRNALCIGIIEKYMPLPLARIYADYILEPGAKDVAADMTTGLLMTYRERIATRDWLDEPTIKRAQKKVDYISQTIAYPDEIMNDEWLDKFYANYNIDSKNLFLNYYQFLQNTISGNLLQLRNNYSVWESIPVSDSAIPTKANAFYSPLQNSINILEGIMGSPAFNKDWPLYSVYGGLGMIIGHEITHGFDNNGRLYNETGQYQNWWTPSSAENFNSRSKCFVDQYGNFEDFGYNVNGEKTLGENIADNGGLGAAYAAYKEAVKKSGAEPQTLPGLNFTPDQLFFIMFGRIWCSYYSQDGFKYTVDQDSHSPGMFRVYGTLQNSKDFADTFKCPSDSYMNPSDKCSLW